MGRRRRSRNPYAGAQDDGPRLSGKHARGMAKIMSGLISPLELGTATLGPLMASGLLGPLLQSRQQDIVQPSRDRAVRREGIAAQRDMAADRQNLDLMKTFMGDDRARELAELDRRARSGDAVAAQKLDLFKFNKGEEGKDRRATLAEKGRGERATLSEKGWTERTTMQEEGRERRHKEGLLAKMFGGDKPKPIKYKWIDTPDMMDPDWAEINKDNDLDYDSKVLAYNMRKYNRKKHGLMAMGLAGPQPTPQASGGIPGGPPTVAAPEAPAQPEQPVAPPAEPAGSGTIGRSLENLQKNVPGLIPGIGSAAKGFGNYYSSQMSGRNLANWLYQMHANDPSFRHRIRNWYGQPLDPNEMDWEGGLY